MAIKLHYIKGMNQRLTMAIAAMLTLSPLANAQQERGVRVGTPGEMTGSPYRRVHVLLVGVNDYLSPTITDLRFAENDVAALRDVLEDRYGFSIPDSSVLLGKNATKGKITSALDSLADSNVVQEGDAIFVYFSMHGQSLPVRGGGMLGFLVPQDAQLSLKDRNAALYHQNAISMQAVWDRLDTSPARHVLVVADACFSGLLVNDRGELPTNDGGDFFALNYGRTGREALVAGSAVQTTKEDDGRKHGRFTYAFVQELKNRANLGRQFVSVALVPVLKESATFGKEQSPEYGKRDGNAGTFTFLPKGAVAAAPVTTNPEPNPGPVGSAPAIAGKFANFELRSDYRTAVAAFYANKSEALALLKPLAETGHPRSNTMYAFMMARKPADRAAAYALYRKLENEDPVAGFCAAAMLYLGNGVMRDKDRGLSEMKKAVDRMIEVAEIDAFAANQVGYYFDTYIGDIPTAAKYYKMGAERGNATAMANYAWTLSLSDSPVDQRLATSWCQRSADMRCAPGMWMMGHLYESGIGVKRDFKAARSWYEKAAATGEPDGMMSLGIDLMRGNQQDARKGFEWLERAANTTNANAVAELGYAYYKGIYWQRSDKTKGLQLLEQAKLNGSGRAHLYLGYIRSDPKSTHLNYVQARLDFEEAALRGYEAGLLWHGNLLWRGQGGPEDKVTATKLYERGAIKGNLVCMHNLATSYSSELNSPIKAAEWYKRAGDRGFYESYQALSLLYLEGKLGSGRNADGIRYMRLAHENGVIEATFLLGTYYEFGKYGLKQDLGEAREFYFKAADAGNEDAKTALKRLQNP